MLLAAMLPFSTAATRRTALGIVLSVSSGSNDSSTMSGRGKSLPGGPKKSGWALYEMKTRNLERNFQRFALTHSRQGPLLANQSTLAIPAETNDTSAFLDSRTNQSYEDTLVAHVLPGSDSCTTYFSIILDELSLFYQRIFAALRTLAITQTQELEAKEVERTCQATLRRLRNHDGDMDVCAAVRRDFSGATGCFMMILDKIQIIASRSFQNYKIRDMHKVFRTLIDFVQRGSISGLIPSMGLAVRRLTEMVALSQLGRTQDRIREHSMGKAMRMLRENGGFLARKLRTIRLRNLLESHEIIRETAVAFTMRKALLSWRLVRSSDQDQMLFGSMLAGINSDSPWDALQRVVCESLKSMGDFVRYCLGEDSLVFFGGIKFRLGAGGVTAAVVRDWLRPDAKRAPVEIEESRLDRRTDVPACAADAHRMVCIPVSDGGELVGVVRVCSSGKRATSSEFALAKATRVATALASILPGLIHTINAQKISSDALRSLELDRSRILTELTLLSATTKSLCNLQSITAREEISRIAEAAARSLVKADTVSFLTVRGNLLFRLGTVTEIAESQLAREALKRGRPVETLRGGHTKIQRTYVPIFAGSDCRGVLVAERSGETTDTISAVVIAGLEMLFAGCTKRKEELVLREEVKTSMQKKQWEQRRLAASANIASICKRLYQGALRGGWATILVSVSFQYGSGVNVTFALNSA